MKPSWRSNITKLHYAVMLLWLANLHILYPAGFQYMNNNSNNNYYNKKLEAYNKE